MIKTVKTKYSDNFYYYEKDFVIGASLELYGEYAQVEIDFLSQVLNKNCIVYDIGANIGYHTRAFANAAAAVYAFEPNLKNFKLLQANTQDLTNICLVNACVSDTNGFACITDFNPAEEGNFGNLQTSTVGQPVLTISLDDFVTPDRSPDLIKIDVEGNEFAVIMGCKKIIETYKPVLYFEAHETKELAEIYYFLTKNGYHLTWCTVMNYNPHNFAGNQNNIFHNTALMSILACPFELPHLHADRVMGPNDNYQAYLDRAKKAYFKSLEENKVNDEPIKKTVSKRKKAATVSDN